MKHENTEAAMRKITKPARKTINNSKKLTTWRAQTVCALLALIAAFSFTQAARAQGAGASPTRSNVYSSPDHGATITQTSADFLRDTKNIIEGLLLKRFVWLAAVVAQLVMAASFLKLMSEKMGLTKDFLGWVARCLVFLPLILVGPYMVTYLCKLGQVITTPMRQPVVQVREAFEVRYTHFVNHRVTARDALFNTPYSLATPDNGLPTIIGVLNSEGIGGTVQSIERVSSDMQGDMKFWVGLFTIARALMKFADFFLVIIGGLLVIAFRLAIPWMICVAVDRSLANEITYRFFRGLIVFTLVFPVVLSITRIIAYSFGMLGLANYEYSSFSVVPGSLRIEVNPALDPITALATGAFMMLVATLMLVASPVISWRIAFGETFQGVATAASGWIAAVSGTGLTLVSSKLSAALNNSAERLQVDATAAASQNNVRAETEYKNRSAMIGLTKELGGFNARRMLNQSLNNASASQQRTNTLAGLKYEQRTLEAQRVAANQHYQTSGEAGVKSAGVSTMVTQDMADVQFKTQDKLVDEQWNAQKWGVGGSLIGLRAGMGRGGATAGGLTSAGGSLGSTVGQRGVLNVQKGAIEYTRDETIGITNEAMANTINNTNEIVAGQQKIEDVRYGEYKGATAERAGAAMGAIGNWQGQANNAQTVYQNSMSGFAREATTDTIDANAALLGRQEQSIAMIRLAGIEAAMKRQEAQVITAVTSDITRRIEEMGALRF
ncbi:MAG: hypothetical protein MSG64_14625 [Pyrinomonadaceae bacterium MAG19_C2-C3]|nr:hypothetical protein [Pyrinomonadaceae bacterium MAG19_C2-C3]